MKKLLCLLLCVILATTALPISSAAKEAPAADATPVILLPGLLENSLIRNRGESGEETIWVSPKAIIKASLHHGLKIVRALLTEDDESLRIATMQFVREAFGGISMNPDGTSVLDNVGTVVSEAAESSYSALQKSGNLRKVTYGKEMLSDIADVIGGDRTFIFQYDWRMSPVDIAMDFDRFVRDVQAMTGCERVNASGTSFGSEILLAYMRDFPETCALHNVLMNSPAYGGSRIVKEMLLATEPINIEYENLVNMILCNANLETEFGYLLHLVPHEWINKLFHIIIRDYICKDFIASVGFWGCCANQDYEALKAALLDPVANAAMIEKADDMQHGLMAKTDTIIRRSQSKGVHVFAIANEGSVLITNHGSGDVLVDAASSTGGVCLEVGDHFSESYRPERIVCTDDTHNHISYTGSLDLTNSYLPETTWVFYGQMHGQNYSDARAHALTIRLLTTDTIQNVYSDPAFPQFAECASRISDLSLTRVDGGMSVLHPDDGDVTLVLTNHSRLHPMRVKALDMNGVPYAAAPTQLLLLPGESRNVILQPTGEKAARYGSITIQYDEYLNPKLHKSRTQYFTVV